MGSWKNNGVQHHRFCLHKGNIFAVVDDYDPVLKGKKYTVKRNYFKVKSSPDLKKCASYLEGKGLID